ncbi:hypothetical protein D3C72_902270 [compost metagenome]
MIGGGQRLRILHVGQLVGVVRHDHFLLADQFPVVAIQRTVEHEHVIVGARTGGTRVRRVVGQARRQLDSTLPRQVLPGATRLLQRVGGVLEHDRLTGAARRAGVRQLHLVVHVGAADRLREVFIDRVGDVRLPGGRQAWNARGVNVPGVVLGTDADALVAQQEVPHRFIARLRNREWNARQHVVDGQATFQGLGAAGVLHAVIQNRLRQRNGAVRREHVDTERRETLGQFYRGRREHALVLIDVLAVDHQYRLFTGKRVRAHAVAGLEAGRRGGQATVVGRNGTISVPGFFSPYLCQAGAQLGSFLS